ncbi:hypothetical protein [Celeribacter baekdonensis]|uniref:Uncharacterized protein n=1 Tax=Celeribacter baekdonensis TaxID=875171 RepID=A0A2R4M7U9_9RHOB|nr:hypothetical protein [Celeribacter baekdonensis]AVW93280.1 hypothetical protein DA792_21180 [Celeribacter baekdonensis]
MDLCSRVAVAALTSPLLGIGFVFAALLHELGSALACRIIGHEVARVRLIPSPIRRARSDRPLISSLEEALPRFYAPLGDCSDDPRLWPVSHFVVSGRSLQCHAQHGDYVGHVQFHHAFALPAFGGGRLCVRFLMRFGHVLGVSSRCS